MTLASGTRLGPFEVLGALGAGGMGEVYRARDTMTSPAQMTRAGVILSTAACMAPEQARSKKWGQP